ncbi:MAG: putative signal peptide-containing protein [Ilumatobacteraceae bacterium]|nr:putative signal peptide-containing protein [Ilumatobacteraceae bacterium]
MNRCGVIAALLIAGLAGCSSSTTPPAAAAVVLVGDSLGVQLAQYLQPLIGQRAFVPEVFGGSAPCDWLNKDLQIPPSAVVVLTFDGNSSSPCMGDGGNGHLAGQAIVDKYRTDVLTLISEARTAGAVVLLVGQPVHAPTVPGNDVVAGLNTMYQSLVHAPDVRFVDAGSSVENADGSFAQSLPCLPGEAQCDPSGFNVVRNDDGLHFCPGSPPPGPCAVYASGAWRFANAIAAAIDAK